MATAGQTYRMTAASYGGGWMRPRTVGAIVLGAPLLLIAAILVLFSSLYGDRIVPGVFVGQYDLGARSLADAELFLRTRFSDLNHKPVTLLLDGEERQVTPMEMGVYLSAAETLPMVVAHGRQENLLERAGSQLQSLFGGVSIEPVLTIDEARFNAAVARLGAGIERDSIDATVAFRDGRASIVTARAGRKIDSVAIRGTLIRHLIDGDSAPARIAVIDTAPVRTSADLQSVLVRIRQIIGTPLTLIGPGAEPAEYAVTSSELDQLLSIVDSGGSGPDSILVDVDQAKVDAIVERLAGEIDQPPENARFQFSDGVLRETQPGRDGLVVDRPALAVALVQALENDDRSVDVPVKAVQPYTSTVTPEQMGIQESLRRQVTNYGGGSPERRSNVELGARLIDGLIVPPGETFSFNAAVGEISEEAGFALGFAIIENQTLPDAGGGICQVSTTLFQSVFFAGMPIAERWAHAYDIGRYHAPYAGIDATIYSPVVDFKFENPLNTALLIQTATDGSNLYVSIYGADPGWRVEVAEPIITNVKKADPEIITQKTTTLAPGREYWAEVARDGMDTVVIRTVTIEGEEPRVGEFRSTYRPQRNVLLVGIDPSELEDEDEVEPESEATPQPTLGGPSQDS